MRYINRLFIYLLTYLLGYGFLFAFHNHYGRIFSLSEIFSVKEWSDNETGVGVVQGH